VAEQLFPTVVMGAGAWGTALAIAIARNGHDVILWGRDSEHVKTMADTRTNERYLPGLAFPETLRLEADFTVAVAAAKHVLVSVPSVAFCEIVQRMQPLLADGVSVSWATKGLTPDSGAFLLESATQILGPDTPLAVISGPSFAAEVAKGLPTAITVASKDEVLANQLALAMHSTSLRAYTSTDVLGVQVGGTVKNVLAIAAGISDGLGYGANARAALLTRGMAEILRLAVSLGAKTDTMFGLAGMGDLILTCTDDQSRNRRLGLAIGRGLSVDAAVADVGKTVEGMTAAKEVLIRAKQAGIEMPIVEQVYKILYEGCNPRESVQALLCREQKAENSLPI
jgi:glycerol-3-phosphate dehydrogenase (NAD(P)+)